MKILVSFSGGKDSQACLIQAFKQGNEQFPEYSESGDGQVVDGF